MPYPNEHAARLQPPSKFDKFRRTKGGKMHGGKLTVPSSIHIIWGHVKGGPPNAFIPQSLRFPTRSWTVAKAKKWLGDHKVKYIKFEPASKGEDIEQTTQELESLDAMELQPYEEELEETLFDEVDVREEVDEKGEKRMRVEAIVQKADTINLNNRIYPKAVMSKAVNTLMPLVKSGKVFGQLDHPSFMTGASLAETSHLVTNLWWDKKDDTVLRGEFLILNTEKGQILQEILRAGGRPGVSSRGIGEVTTKRLKGGGEVQVIKPGFRFRSFDFVIDPSVKSAQITKIIESRLGSNGTSDYVYTDTTSKSTNWWEVYVVEDEGNDDGEEELNLEVESFKDFIESLQEESMKDKEKKEEKELKKESEEVKTENKEEDGKATEADNEELDKLRKEKEGLEVELASRDEKIQNLEKVLTSIAEAVEQLSSKLTEAGFLKAPEEKKEEEKDEKEEKIKNMEKEISTLREELAKTAEKMKEKEVEAFIAQELEGKPYAALMKKRLKECKTIDEVKKKLKEDEDLIQTLLTEKETFGKGFTEVGDKDEEMAKVRKEAKKLAGIKE